MGVVTITGRKSASQVPALVQQIYAAPMNTPRSVATDGAGVWVQVGGDASNASVYYSTNRVDWNAGAFVGSPVPPFAIILNDVATDKAGTWIAISTDRQLVYKSTDNGATWSQVDIPAGLSGTTRIVFYYPAIATWYILGNTYLYSVDGGDSWTEFFALGPGHALNGGYAAEAVSLTTAVVNGLNGRDDYTDGPDPKWGAPAESLIVASDAGTDDHFSEAPVSESSAQGPIFLTRDGQYLFVSAVDNDVTVADQGRVYVYEDIAGTWTEKQIIDNTGSPLLSASTFGINIAASYDGTHVLIGTSAAEVHYYELVTGTWTFRQVIADHEVGTAAFGISVDISDDGSVALIGNYSFDQTTGEGYPSNLLGTGKAYFFNRSGTTWTLSQEIDPPDRLLNGRFGGSFSLSPDGTHALIGQPEQSGQSGRVYAYENTGGSPAGWTNTQELATSATHTNRRFGRGKMQMSADGSIALVPAAFLTFGVTTTVGGGFVYTRSGGTWTEQQLLQPSDGASFTFGIMGDNASASISNDGGTIVMGAWNQTTGGQAGNGAAYVWTGTPGSYVENAKILPSTAESQQRFGQSTALRTNDELFVGAPQRNGVAGNMGVVFALVPGPTVWFDAGMDGFGNSGGWYEPSLGVFAFSNDKGQAQWSLTGSGGWNLNDISPGSPNLSHSFILYSPVDEKWFSSNSSGEWFITTGTSLALWEDVTDEFGGISYGLKGDADDDHYMFVTVDAFVVTK